MNKKKIIEGIKLNKEQEEIFNMLDNNNNNVYITGKAGTGKSLLLQYFVDNTKKKCVVLAPTGVAALNIGGQTIHSFFQFTPDIQNPKTHETIRVYYKTKEILRNIDTLIIDEVSMVGVDLMESINIKCQKARDSKLPFGGLQLICFGDLYQLPPVVTDKEIYRYLNDLYGGIFFFNAPVFENNPLELYELEHIHRQRDDEFKNLLNKIRLGVNSYSVINAINGRCTTDIPEEGYIILAGRNDTVSRINMGKLSAIDSKEYIYNATISGDIKESIFPTEKELHLKVGAQVMMLVNDKVNRWVNGTIGVITDLNKDIIKVKIDNVEHTVDKHTWCKYRYNYNQEDSELEKEEISSFKQFPLRLAWAITIHKSQGKTYQAVLIDLADGAFDCGQTYVALSRCVSLDNIYLKEKIEPGDIKVSAQVLDFMKRAKIIKIKEGV